MTISNISARRVGPSPSNGASTAYPFTFKVFAPTDIVVTLTSSAGVDSVQAYLTQYTVALNTNQDASPGGTVNLAAAPPVGTSITITTAAPATQGLLLTALGGFFPASLNDAFDKLTILIQQLTERAGRALTLPVSSTASGALPPPVAGQLLSWNSTADGIVNAGLPNGSLLSSSNTWTQPQSFLSGVASPAITAPAGQSLSLGANGTPMTTLSAAGNLGLNVTPIDGYGQSVQLRNSGATSALLLQTINATVQSLYLTNNLMPPVGGYTGTFVYTFTGAAGSMYQQAAGAHYWASAPAGTAGATANASVNMVLDASGNLGLGVTPSAWGTVKAIQIGNGASFGGHANFYDAYVTTNAYYNGAAWARLNAGVAPQQISVQSSDGSIVFNQAAGGAAGSVFTWTPSMKLDATGSLLVGQTTSGSTGGVNANGVQLSPGTAVISHITGTATGAAYISFGYAAGAIGSITQNGTTAVSYNTTSDQRLKTDLGTPTESRIAALTIHDFEWIADGSKDRGVFAQEAHAVLPGAVHVGGDELNADGNPIQPWGVDYSKFVPDLILEVQLLRARVAALEAAK